jgi:hypothetical protein
MLILEGGSEDDDDDGGDKEGEKDEFEDALDGS